MGPPSGLRDCWWPHFKHFLLAVNKTTRKGREQKHKYADIWLTEQGVIFLRHGPTEAPRRNGHAAQYIMRAYVDHAPYGLTHLSKQIVRFFYYQMMGELDNAVHKPWDSGLLFPPGEENGSGEKPRRIYYIYCHHTTTSCPHS